MADSSRAYWKPEHMSEVLEPGMSEMLESGCWGYSAWYPGGTLVLG